MNINEVTISGNVARDPSRVESAGSALIYFDIAHQKNSIEVEFYKCLAMGNLALNLRNLSKGDYVIIRGKINSFVSEDSNGRLSRPYFEIECSHVMRCDYVAMDREPKKYKSKDY